MKHNIIFSIYLCLFGAMLLVGCDKVDQDSRIVFSGAAGTWYDGNGVSDHSQRALIEKYTGPRCNNCPNADNAIHAALDAYSGKLIAISIHDSSYFGTPMCDVDMRTDDGNSWSTYFGFRDESKPSAFVNRATAHFDPKSGIEALVDPIVANEPVVALEVSSQINGTTASIDVNVEYLRNCSDNLTVTLVLIEDGIVATQMMPDGSHNENYVHNHILRDVITDIWGADVDADGTAGCKRHAIFQYAIPSSEWNLENCHVVAFLSYPDKKIANTAECPLGMK